MRQLFRDVKTDRVMTSQAAGTSALQTNSSDNAGFQNVAYALLLGTIVTGAVTSFKVQHSDDNATWADVENSNQVIPDTSSNKVFLTDCFKPTKRYTRGYITRGTQNATIDGVMALMSGARTKPVTQPATVGGAKYLVSANTGVA